MEGGVFSFLMQISVILLIVAIACTQIFLLFKYIVVRGTLRRMQETSSGDDIRYKSAASRRKIGNGK
jgi:hypothetical protein